MNETLEKVELSLEDIEAARRQALAELRMAESTLANDTPLLASRLAKAAEVLAGWRERLANMMRERDQASLALIGAKKACERVRIRTNAALCEHPLPSIEAFTAEIRADLAELKSFQGPVRGSKYTAIDQWLMPEARHEHIRAREAVLAKCDGINLTSATERDAQKQIQKLRKEISR